MKVGIVGSGMIGGTLARLLSSKGHDVAISNQRGPESLEAMANEGNGNVLPMTVEGALEFGKVVVIAVPLHAVFDLPVAGTDGKTVVDATNYYPNRDGQIEMLVHGPVTSSALVADHFPNARVVKAFNTMHFKTLGTEGRPPGDPNRLVLFLAGDDSTAKDLVAGLIDDVGFDPYDTGGLGQGGALQEPGSPIYNKPLTRLEAAAILDGQTG
jgi:8-hydroxy-5-deazaflavin:NADPH oxidoreductase